jgi:FtsP/CotA-like multicopper oxidase with cupredoxin domain
MVGVRRRVSLFASLGVGVLAATAVPLASTAVAHGPARTVVAQSSGAGACSPAAPHGSPVPLPLPTAIDASKTPSFQIDVLTDQTVSPALYCYVVHGTTTTYVEAPTIYVPQGAKFSMTLADKIVPIGPSPLPTPQAYSDDKTCALLNYEPTPTPSPIPSAYQGNGRIPATEPMPGMVDGNTNFHTHGFHIEPDVDNVFKSLAQSANGTCVYNFQVQANQPPGTYWYHAHLHGVSDAQVGGGLGGTIVVVPAPAPSRTPSDLDLPDTVLLVKNYNGPPPAQTAQLNRRLKNSAAARLRAKRPAPRVRASAAFDPFNPPPYESGVSYPTIPANTVPDPCVAQGGPTALGVNGAAMPTAATDAALATTANVPTVYQDPSGPGMRYRIVNASSDDYLNVRLIDGAGRYINGFKVLARDGVPVNWNLDTGRIDPLKPDAVLRDNVFLAPSNRVDIFVPAKLRATIIGAAQKAPFCTGALAFAGIPPRGIVSIVPTAQARAMRHTLGGNAARLMAIHPLASATTPTFADLFAAKRIAREQQRALTFSEYDDGTFYVTETGSRPQPLPAPWIEHPFWLQPAVSPPGPSPLPTDSRYQADIWVKKLPRGQRTIEIWNLYNATGEAHAFHIHQMTFVSLKSQYEPSNGQRVFLDSIAIPPATVLKQSTATTQPQLQPSLTQIQIDFTNVDPGTFVFHCHMLFHEDHGMMGIIHLY